MRHDSCIVSAHCFTIELGYISGKSTDDKYPTLNMKLQALHCIVCCGLLNIAQGMLF